MTALEKIQAIIKAGESIPKAEFIALLCQHIGEQYLYNFPCFCGDNPLEKHTPIHRDDDKAKVLEIFEALTLIGKDK